MVSEILGALEFTAFLAVFAAAAAWISHRPWYTKLSERLFPEVHDAD